MDTFLDTFHRSTHKGEVIVKPSQVCRESREAPTSDDAFCPYLSGDSQLCLAMAQIQLAMLQVTTVDLTCDFLSGAAAAPSFPSSGPFLRVLSFRERLLGSTPDASQPWGPRESGRSL